MCRKEKFCEKLQQLKEFLFLSLKPLIVQPKVRSDELEDVENRLKKLRFLHEYVVFDVSDACDDVIVSILSSFSENSSKSNSL